MRPADRPHHLSETAPPSERRARPGAIARLSLVCVLVLGTACQLTVTVGIDAGASGSGTVRVTAALDAAAARAVPDLAEHLDVQDLRRAGWLIEGPRKVSGGGVEVVASHPFRHPDEVGRLVEQISGEDGPFRDFGLTQTRSAFSTRTRFRGSVDLSGGIESFGDQGLRDRLGGSSLGASASELERQLGGALDRVFRFQVAVRLPGVVESNAPTTAGNGAVWKPRLGEQADLVATAERTNTRNAVFAVVALVFGFAAVSVLAVRVVRRRRGLPEA